MKDKVQDLVSFIRKLEESEKQLLRKENNIYEKVKVQNDRYEKLWKGYEKSNLTENNFEKNITPIIHDDFVKKYEKLVSKLNSLINQVGNTKDKFNIRNKLEKCIIEIATLLEERWMTILELKKLKRTERLNIKRKVLSSHSDIEKLLINSKDSENWKNKTKDFFKFLIDKIELQFNLYLKEESYINEMEFIYEQREEIYKRAVSIFSI